MREADFAALPGLIECPSGEQRAASGGPETVRPIEQQAFAAASRCPRCGATGLQRWRRASGLSRYRCTTCRKTLSALTDSSLTRLRKKAWWLRHGDALSAARA